MAKLSFRHNIRKALKIMVGDRTRPKSTPSPITDIKHMRQTSIAPDPKRQAIKAAQNAATKRKPSMPKFSWDE